MKWVVEDNYESCHFELPCQFNSHISHKLLSRHSGYILDLSQRKLAICFKIVECFSVIDLSHFFHLIQCVQ